MGIMGRPLSPSNFPYGHTDWSRFDLQNGVSYQCSIVIIALERTVLELGAWDRQTDGLTYSNFG